MKKDAFTFKKGAFAPEQNRVYLYGELFPRELYMDTMVDSLVFCGREEEAIIILKRIVRSLLNYRTKYTVGLFDGRNVTYCTGYLFQLGNMDTALSAYKTMKRKLSENEFTVQQGFIGENKYSKHTQKVNKKIVFIRVEGSPKLRQDFVVVGNPN